MDVNEKTGNPMATTTDVEMMQPGAQIDPAYQQDRVPNLQVAQVAPGRWRGDECDGLCDCLCDCQCPMFCFVSLCPQVMWAQLWYEVYTDKPRYQVLGYWVIFLGFSLIFLVSYGISAAGKLGDFGAAQAFQMVGHVSSFVLILSLYKRIRERYNVRGNECNRGCCGELKCGSRPCCGDEYADCCEAFWCTPCATMKLGHHVFDFSSDSGSAITYEPLSAEFDLIGETKSAV